MFLQSDKRCFHCLVASEVVAVEHLERKTNPTLTNKKAHKQQNMLMLNSTHFYSVQQLMLA